VFVDTFLVNWPYFGLMIFLTGIIENKGSVMDGINKVKDKLAMTMVMSWSVWPLFIAALYGIIPMYMRSVADNCFDAMWSIFFSYMQHRKVEH